MSNQNVLVGHQHKEKLTKRLKLGEYIVTDPDICHGKPTFKGTRIMVKQVPDMVAEGIAWDEIIAEYDGAISREAIAEAVRIEVGR